MSLASDNPNLKVNRYPWQRHGVARETIEAFMASAEHRMVANPDALPFRRELGELVLAWLRARLDVPPG